MNNKSPDEQLRIVGEFLRPDSDKEQICLDAGVDRKDVEDVCNFLRSNLSQGLFIDAILDQSTGRISVNGVSIGKEQPNYSPAFNPKFLRLIFEGECFLSRARLLDAGPEEIEPRLKKRSLRQNGEGVDISLFQVDTGSAFSAISTGLAKSAGIDFNRADLGELPAYDVKTTLGKGSSLAGVAEFVFFTENWESPLALELPVSIFSDTQRRAILGLQDMVSVFDFEFLRFNKPRRVVRFWPIQEMIGT